MAKTCVETSRTDKISAGAFLKIIITATFEAADSGAVALAGVAVNGLLEKLTLFCPNMTNAVTMTLTVTDEDGGKVLVTPASLENNNYVFYLSDPIAGSLDLSFAISGVPGATGGIFQAILRIS